MKNSRERERGWKDASSERNYHPDIPVTAGLGSDNPTGYGESVLVTGRRIRLQVPHGLESVDARLLVYKKNKSVYEEDIKVLKCEIHLREVAITELRRKLELAQKQKDEIQLTVENFKNSSKNLIKLIECQIVDNCKTGLGYNAVPPPYTGNFMPPKPDLSFFGLEEYMNEPIVCEPIVKKPVVKTSEAKGSTDKPKVVMKNFGPPLIEEWISDSEDEAELKPKIEKKTVKPSFAKIKFVKSKKQVKSPRKTTIKQGDQNRLNTHSPRGNQRNWDYMMCQRLGSNFEMINKSCYVCGSFDHLQYDCDNHQRQFNNFQSMVKPVWNNAKRVNHQNFSKKTHPCPKKNMVPRAILMKSGLVSLNTARQVNTAHPKIIMNSARPMTNLYKTVHSTVKTPIHKNTTFKNSNFNQRVNTVKDKNVNTAKPKAVVNTARQKAILNAVKGNHVNTPDLWIVVLRIGKLQGIGEFSGVGFISTQQMVINSPCLTDTKNWLFQCKRHLLASPKQTALELAIPGQTATGKESSNPFMAGSLPKTIHFCDSLQSDEDSFELIELMILCTNFLTMGRIDDADAEVTFIDETLNDARNKNNKISNNKVEDDKETALEVKKCLDTSSW
ncbi:hypothetical protein Tco_0316553 [Tanacetum coccineum]